MTAETFAVAGVSTREGVIKARFAKDMMRVKVLAKTGSTDIDLIELPHSMTKVEAVEYLLSIDFDNGNLAVRTALETALDKRAPKAANRDKPKKEAKKPKKEKAPAPKAITLEGIAAKATKAKTSEMEDAPF